MWITIFNKYMYNVKTDFEPKTDTLYYIQRVHVDTA